MAGAVDVLFVDEAGQISLANVVAIARGDGQPRPARRPAAARPAAPGDASAGRGPVGAGARPRRARPRCRRTAGCSSRRPGGSIPTCAPTRPRSSTTAARAGAAPRAASGRTPPVDARRRDRAAARSTCPRRRGQRVARRGRRRSPARRAALVEGGATWIDAQSACDRRIGWDDVLIVAPYNAQVGDDPASAADGGPGRDGRQVPGPGGADQHLLDDDVEPGAGAARHGLPVQPAPAERRDVAGRCVAIVVASPGPAPRPRPEPGADAPGERVVPVRRGADPARSCAVEVRRRIEPSRRSARSAVATASRIRPSASDSAIDADRYPRPVSTAVVQLALGARAAPAADRLVARRRRRPRQHGPHRRGRRWRRSSPRT